jgi:hypothetical protein
MHGINAVSKSASGHADVNPPADATSDDKSSSPAKLTGAALWTAIAAVLVWVGFSAFLIIRAGTSDTEWSRIAWVFGSIQAIAFAAAGALFGTTVQQRNVNNAQRQAESAKKDANQQREDAAKGRALATAIQAEAAIQPADGPEGQQRMGVSSASGAESTGQLRQRHAQLSRAMFGDLIPAAD